MKVIFFIAHPDDEAYGPFGTISTLVKQGHDVSIFCLCNGERPGAQQVSSGRIKSFIKNCELVGAKWRMWDNPDLSLEINETAMLVSNIVEIEQPDVIYTHNITDINKDHRTLAEAVLIASRPKPSTSVQSLYFFEIPSSTNWTFHKLEPSFQPNTYIELSEEEINIKKAALEEYTTEIYDFPDARSVEAILTLAKYRGCQVGYNFAEAFQLVFSRSRRST